MTELLLELFSEEIPARMQGAAAEQLQKKAEDAFKKSGVPFDSVQTFVTARRLVLVADGIPEKQEDVSEEIKGPKVDAPEQALAGFLKKTGLTKDQLEARDTDKGAVYFAVIEQKGKQTNEILPELLQGIIEGFHWPKSMRWGSGTFRWVRPLKNICCVFGGDVLPFNIAHLTANNQSYGHRFAAPEAFAVTGFAQYSQELKKRFVMLDAAERKAEILSQAEALVSAKNLKLHEDAGLLEEVAGLSEWPVVLLGDMEPSFLKLPQEVLMTSMKSHQKYFSVVDAEGKIAPHTIIVSQNPKKESHAAILDGNSRVLKARLSDGEFFFAQDKKKPLADYLRSLDTMVFHAKIGTMYERVRRITELSKLAAVFVPHASLTNAAIAARLAKADLGTEMVGEFPELQGIMGSYYTDEDPEIAAAIREHYAPLGPSDACPTAPLSVVVSLSDKTDLLAGMFAINEQPTGSKDPFALRRAALGIIRLILENKLDFSLSNLFASALKNYPTSVIAEHKTHEEKTRFVERLIPAIGIPREQAEIIEELMQFFEERLKHALKSQGTRHDLITAVFALGEDNLLQVTRRVVALEQFVDSEDGKNLLAAYTRSSNILKKEEQKDNNVYDGKPDMAETEAPEEQALLKALNELEPDIEAGLKEKDYTLVLTKLSSLRGPVDAFFDKVQVNAENESLRKNRLRILGRLRALSDQIADFSKIEG